MRGSLSKIRFPNLIVAGAAKAGTTSLHYMLNEHPDICMSPGKEPHCLTREDRSISDYNVMFAGDAAKYYGESSTMYMVFPYQIGQFMPSLSDTKFIFLLRNPVERAWSHYWWAKGTRGRERRDFRDAFLEDTQRSPALPVVFNDYYYHCGRYSHWLARYREFVENDNMFVLPFERMIEDPKKMVREIWSAFGLSTDHSIRTTRANPTSLVRFPSVLQGLSHMGAMGRRILSWWLPARANNGLVRFYRQLVTRVRFALAGERPPALESEDREWIREWYVNDVASLRRSIRNSTTTGRKPFRLLQLTNRTWRERLTARSSDRLHPEWCTPPSWYTNLLCMMAALTEMVGA